VGDKACAVGGALRFRLEARKLGCREAITLESENAGKPRGWEANKLGGLDAGKQISLEAGRLEC
jgi:hypothetical protein